MLYLKEILQSMRIMSVYGICFGFHLYKLKKANEKKTHVRYFEDTQQQSQLLRKYLLN